MPLSNVRQGLFIVLIKTEKYINMDSFDLAGNAER